jgi:hypothetical protein
MRKARIMENGTSKIERLIEAQRLAAELTALAVEHGAQHDPQITVYSFGVFVNLGLDDKPADREIAAWQLATGGVWEVETTRFEYDGVGMKSDRATVRVGDTYVTVTVRTTDRQAVAA